MKILRIIYDFPPPWNGLAPFPWELSRAQLKLNEEVTVLCGLWPNQKPDLENIPRDLHLVRILREPFKGTFFFTSALMAFFYILSLRSVKKFDVIHGHGHFPIYFHFLKILLGPLDRMPYFFHLHITAAGREKQAREMKENIDFLTRFIEWPLHKLSDRIGCRIAKKIFVTGEKVREEAVLYYGTDPRKIVVLENGVSTDLFSPDGESKRRELGYTPEDRIILFIGAHNDRKNLDKVIVALKTLPPNYKLLSIGSGPTEYRGFLEDKIKELGLETRVQFMGSVPYPYLPPYYRTGNLLILPSNYEGFPKVVLEALSSGTKVLASGFKVNEKVAGLFFIENLQPKELSAQIVETMASTEIPIHAEIEKRYSWQTMAEKIQKEYAEQSP